MDVVDRFALRAAARRFAQPLVVDRLADQRGSMSLARSGAGPRPPRVSDARVTLPAPSSSMSAAAETMAKSPWRRENSRRLNRAARPAGNVAPVRSSSGSSAGVI